MMAAAHRMVGFVRTLRDNGYAVGLPETRDALRIVASPEAVRPIALKSALRALLCARRDEWERFDELFDAFWLGHGMRTAKVAPASGIGNRRPMPGRATPGAGSLGSADHPEPGQQDAADGRGRRGGATAAEALAATDVRHISDPDDLAAVHALTQRLARRMRARLLRRYRARRHGRRLDLRRTIHKSIGRGGTPVDMVWRKRKTKPLRLIVLLDASGSMSLYTAFFVRFLHGVVGAFRRAEAFVFHTRLACVSGSLRDHNAARAIDRMALLAQGIGGGTRIGECLAVFNRWHAARLVDRHSAVIIVSDGYDTGAPDALAAEMRRLRRRCRRMVWLNPLIGWRDYAPEARGMQAALPFIDLFAAAHNVESLAALEGFLARI
jgi:uncharacterized protein with von Willebrand factor type A (vWA) domain